MRHLISIRDLDANKITRVLDTSEGFVTPVGEPARKYPTLRARTVCNLFLEDSTRTRISFDIAAKRLSADVINFSAKGSSVSKGESFKDTALTLNAMGIDAVVIRSASAGAPLQLSRYLDLPILNAGDGWHQHPTQALLDLFTLRQHFGRLEGLHVAIVGDVLHSRVARSEIEGLATMGARVTLVAPDTLLPPSLAPWDVEVTSDLDGLLPDLDVVYLLRVQRERMHRAFFPTTREYARLYGMTPERLAALPDGAVVLHPGPMNRGVEITADVADSASALVTDQVANGVSVRMACLYLLLGGGGERAVEQEVEQRPKADLAGGSA
jgi:aspartate carbamoyltransferase catalytic subunit